MITTIIGKPEDREYNSLLLWPWQGSVWNEIPTHLVSNSRGEINLSTGGLVWKCSIVYSWKPQDGGNEGC